MNPQELRQAMTAKADEARAIYDDAKEEDRSVTPEQETRYRALIEEAKGLRAEAERLEELEGFVAVAKPQSAKYHPPTVTRDTEKSLYFRFLRTGDQGIASELRAYNNTDMNEGTPAAGGVTVPTGMVQDIMARRDELSLVPKLGLTNVPGKGLTVNYPIDNEDDVIFTSVAEKGTINQDSPALTNKAFTLVKFGKFITLTWELLRDEDVRLEAFLTNWVARGWAATLNNALVVEALANGTASLTLASPTAIAAGDIPNLVGKLAPEYREGAMWLMNPTAYATISAIASSSVFTFAPHPGGDLAGGGSAYLWGFPVNQTSYMPTPAASAKSMIFGNFQFMGYREGTSLQTIRDPYTAITTGNVRLWYWFDSVFGVLQAEAIRYATQST